MQLQEALDNPYSYSWNIRSKVQWSAVFFSGAPKAENLVRVLFEGWEIDNMDLELFNIPVDTVGKYGYGINFFKGRKQTLKITNEGDAFRIFATVRVIVEEFINKRKPDVISFAAKEKSRKRLYARFSKQLAKKHNWDLSISKEGSSDLFTLH